MENAMKNSSAGAVQNSGQPPADPAADQPEVKEDLLPLSKRRGFALIALLGGWFFTNEYLEYFGGVYPLLFAAAFLLLTLWFISGRRKLHLKRPLFLLASAALLIGSGRFMVYGADEIKELWFLLLPLLGVLSATALACYLAASRRLPLGLFGLLGYLEPALLFGVSLLLGERMAPGAAWTYVPIWLALAVLALDGVQQWRRRRPQP